MGLRQDLRYALRTLRKAPGFVALAVASLALGIGAAVAVFSLFDALLVKSLPIRSPEQLYTSPSNISYPQFLLYRNGREAAALTAPARFSAITPDGSTESAQGQLVSGEYFSVLGVRAAAGRLLSPDDVDSGIGTPAAVLSYAYWRRSHAEIGQTMRLNGTPLTIVGVAERGFFGLTPGESPDVWIPLTLQSRVRYFQNAYADSGDPNQPWAPQPGIRWLRLIVRTQTPAAIFDSSDRRALTLEPCAQGFSSVRARFSKPVRAVVWMVTAALLIACANIATLLLARGSNRRQEMAIRMALGATRARLLRQLLTESATLSLLGGAIGIALAAWANLALPRALSIDLDLRLDAPLLLFTVALTLGLSFLFGLPPALSSTKMAPSLHRRARAANILVVAQVALSLLLVTGAALLSRTLANLLRQDLGFDRDRVLTVRIDPLAAGLHANQLPALYEALEQRVQAIPGVRSISLAESTVAGGSATGANGVRVPGYTPSRDEDMSILENFVEPGYFATMGMRVMEGRDFDSRDRAGAPNVAIVNEAMSRRFFRGASPLGKRYGYGGAQFEIIGVVRDARVRNPRTAPSPMAYRPIRQQLEYAQSLEVRVAADPRTVIPHLRKTIADVEPNLPVLEIATLAERVDRALADERLLAQLSAFFAAFALLLACIGIYGLLSYQVASRTAEIGVRMALGAQRISVIELILREGFTPVAVGLGLGLALIAFTTRLIGSILFGVAPTDPVIIVVAAAAMLIAALVAASVPAWRASRVDPMKALRQD